MCSLYLDLKPKGEDRVELRYFFDNPNQYQQRILEIAGIADLIQTAERDYYTILPENFALIGQKLYRWLDGSDRWLENALSQFPGEGMVLAIATSEKLAHLPWEVLHNESGFLLAQQNPVRVPVRWLPQKAATPSQPLPNRALQVLFMASSPLGVKPVLEFELEEARILQATAKQPLALTVEESGCLSELANLIASYDNGYFDVLHLTGHANLKNSVPLFLLETETGEPYEASAEEIAKALQFRFPPLVFLSGCRTGEAPKAGDVPSMALSLLQQGATAVLGWGRPVLDSNGIDAAAALYGNLAAGYELAQAVSRTYQTLLEKKARDWHLLRLYIRGAVPEALVTPLKTPGRKKAPFPSVATEFLDSAGKVKVPTRESFVGRRRQLQKCLQALKYSPENEVGVLIHGMGGLGKSSLAARLCDRLTDFERIVWVGEIDEPSLVHRLANKLDDQFLRETLQSNDEELKFKLRRVFVQLEEKSAKPLLLVLDDFKANLEPRGDTFVLNPEAASVLSALVFAIQESNTQHRLILTCRYDFDFSLLQHFYKQPLDALQGADLEKKCSSLNSFKFNSGVDNELQVKALHLADGNPRLLEWLDKVLQSPENTTVDADAILQRLEDSKVELREKVLAKTLLGMINLQMREVLQLGLVFDLPVPREAMIEIASHIPECVNYIDSAIALGLLESSFDHCLRVPRILFIDSEENLSFSLPILQQAAQILHRLWYVNAETSTEEQRLEIHRLALAAQETDIAAEIATALTNRWIAQSRFRETLQICKSTLDVTQDYRVLHNLAYSEKELGEVEQAKHHYQEVLNNCPPEDEQYKATTIHNLAGIYANQGNVTEAIALYQQSLELKERIGNVQGKAASLHQLAIIYANQGNVTEAIALYQQCLELDERIGNVQGKAASLHQLAGIYANQGNVTEAIALYQQSLELKERIGDVQGKAASLAMLGQLLADTRGDFSTALSYLEQSLEILQHLQSPDAQVVRGIIARIQESAKKEQNNSGENTPAPRRGVNVSQILILSAVMLLCIGGFFVFKLQQGGFTPNKSNPTLSPR